jgi:hypothetical protein
LNAISIRSRSAFPATGRFPASSLEERSPEALAISRYSRRARLRFCFGHGCEGAARLKHDVKQMDGSNEGFAAPFGEMPRVFQRAFKFERKLVQFHKSFR